MLTVGTDNPAYPPWYAGGTPKGSYWKINDPSNGKGFESAVAYAVATKLGFPHSQVKWIYVPFNRSYAPGPKPFDFDINQISYHAGAREGRVVQLLVLRREPGARRAQGDDDRERAHRRRPRARTSSARSSARRATSFITEHDQAVAVAGRLPAERRRDPGAEEQADRRPRRRPARPRSTSPPSRCRTRRSSGSSRRAAGGEHFGMVFAKGNPLVACVDRALAALKANGTLEEDPAAVASEGDRRAGPEVDGARSSKVLGGWRAGDGRRGVADRARSAPSSSSS